jgi:hypothetical protein
VKNSEIEAYKFQGEVHSNKTETGKYKEPHEEKPQVKVHANIQ